MNYRNFLLLAERYYKPSEKLPSGRSPIQKAMSRNTEPVTPAQRSPILRSFGGTPEKVSSQEVKRREMQKERIGKVKRGAGNKYFDRTPSKDPDIKVYPIGPRQTEIQHNKHNITMNIYHSPRGYHEVSWYHTNPKIRANRETGKMEPISNKEKLGIIRNVTNLWKNDVQHRFPTGHQIKNYPMPNDNPRYDKEGNEVNTRLKKYSKLAGFGPKFSSGFQYAKAGHRVSPRQAASGKIRFKPINPEDE